MRVIKLNPADLGPALHEAVAVLKSGGLVAYPTESFYALGADALNADAVEKIFLAKRRSIKKPLPVIIHDKALLSKYVRELSPVAAKAVEFLMPGPVTLIFWAREVFPSELTSGTGKVGIRVPEHEIALSLARIFGGPLTATSANLSGHPGPTSPGEVAASLADALDLILDGGITPGPPPSTLLDLTSSPPALVREGRLGKPILEAVLGALSPL
jgi:L-threonylcarbamoyladenylate synthase